MKTSYKKYGIGGVAQSFGSPMIESGMQTVTGNWGGSPVSVFAKGGYTKRISENDLYRFREKTKHERIDTEGVGNFELPKDKDTRYLYELNDFDKNLVKDIKLKPNEHIFRYETYSTKIGGYIPLVKINLDNQMVYFLTENAWDGGDIEFVKKGEKAQFINISDKYAQGGKIENQYEGKTPSDIWNMLSLEQRQHFLYDHKDQIEAYRGEEYGELTSREIITAYRSDWAKLDNQIKNRFKNHVREGQYGGGGRSESNEDKFYAFDVVFAHAPRNQPQLTERMFVTVRAKTEKEAIKYAKEEVRAEFRSSKPPHIFSKISPILKSVQTLKERIADEKRRWDEQQERIKNESSSTDSMSQDQERYKFSDLSGLKNPNTTESFAQGGMFEVGDWVAEKKGTARGQVYKKLGSFIYLKDKYGNESQTLYSEDKFKKSATPRYDDGGEVNRKEKIELMLDDYTDSKYFNSSYGTLRSGFKEVKVVVNMVLNEYGYAKMKGKYVVIDIESEQIMGHSNDKKIFNTKQEAIEFIEKNYSNEDEQYDDGGQAKISIANTDIKFDKSLYKGILDDYDLDGLPNADDPNPYSKKDKVSLEQTKLSTAVNNVINVKNKMDDELDVFVKKLQQVAPSDSKIYGRTKTPFSILNKLVNSRLLDQKRGLKDLVGTTVAFENYQDLQNFKKRVDKGMFGKVVDFDDYYENPNDGYRAYHYIVEQDGTPIELQLKTDRMKEINVLSHDAYKNQILNKDYLLYLTTIANDADKGNTHSMEQFSEIMSNKVAVKKKMSSGK